MYICKYVCIHMYSLDVVNEVVNRFQKLSYKNFMNDYPISLMRC